jgi:hypothetical protein
MVQVLSMLLNHLKFVAEHKIHHGNRLQQQSSTFGCPTNKIEFKETNGG